MVRINGEYNDFVYNNVPYTVVSMTRSLSRARRASSMDDSMEFIPMHEIEGTLGRNRAKSLARIAKNKTMDSWNDVMT
jgi:hypothetical protein